MNVQYTVADSKNGPNMSSVGAQTKSKNCVVHRTRIGLRSYGDTRTGMEWERIFGTLLCFSKRSNGLVYTHLFGARIQRHFNQEMGKWTKRIQRSVPSISTGNHVFRALTFGTFGFV